jgi:hypothetical protein
LGDALASMELSLIPAITAIATLAILLLVDHMLTYDDGTDSSAVLTRRGGFIYFVWIILLVWALLLSKDMVSTFIYFQF